MGFLCTNVILLREESMWYVLYICRLLVGYILGYFGGIIGLIVWLAMGWSGGRSYS